MPESFNVLVKELQGLGLKVDLVHSDMVVDAEEVLATNIHEEATHPAAVEVPQDAVSEIDVTEEVTGDTFGAEAETVDAEDSDEAVPVLTDEGDSSSDGADDVLTAVAVDSDKPQEKEEA